MNSVYETTPEPPPVKRLAHIGRMPVPWVTCYHDSQTRYPVRYIEYGAADVCDCEPGDATHLPGKPLLGHQCPARQRAAMVERRCSTCGTRIKGVALFAGPHLHTDEDTNIAPGVLLTAEAPLHPRCLAYAALACPDLFNADALFVVSARGGYTLLDQWRLTDPRDSEQEYGYNYYPHNTPRPLRLPNGIKPVLGYVYAQLDSPDQKVTLLDSWMRRSAPERYRGLWSRNHEIGPTLGQFLASPSTPVAESPRHGGDPTP